ncbi:adenylate kinase family protein [Nanoarchaeota archaeon]
MKEDRCSIILGPPLSGKGTCAGKISEKLGYAHISTGDMFRKMAEDNHPLGVEAKEKYWGHGDYVPDEMTTELVFARLERSDCKNGWILDGYPRTIKQANSLEKEYPTDLVFYLNISLETAVKRAACRRICSNDKCNFPYNLKTAPPKKEGLCDKCDSKLYQRKDDSDPSIIKHRLEVYKEKTLPVVELYKKRQLECTIEGFYEIDANLTSEEVLDSVKRYLRKEDFK